VYDLETETTFHAATDVVSAQSMLWLWMTTDAGAPCAVLRMLASGGWMRKTAGSVLLRWPHHFMRKAEALVCTRHWPA
jgi:hypothetical protein